MRCCLIATPGLIEVGYAICVKNSKRRSVLRGNVHSAFSRSGRHKEDTLLLDEFAMIRLDRCELLSHGAIALLVLI
jgi:hypothetical protein